LHAIINKSRHDVSHEINQIRSSKMKKSYLIAMLMSFLVVGTEAASDVGFQNNNNAKLSGAPSSADTVNKATGASDDVRAKNSKYRPPVK